MNRFDYIEEFKKMPKFKLSIPQTKSLFLGLIFKLVLDKDILDKKKIYRFIEETLNKTYKEYVFRGRPYLASRVLKDLEVELDYNDLLKISKKIVDFLSEDMEDSSNNKKNTNNNNVIGWYNSVNE